jgi:hypothetical protein
MSPFMREVMKYVRAKRRRVSKECKKIMTTKAHLRMCIKKLPCGELI